MEHTGDAWEGPTVSLADRPEGIGTYTFANGDYYVGQVRDGMFHGKGILYFKGNGFGRFEGEWKKGLAVKGDYVFSDHLFYKEDGWRYLTPEDRRMASEYLTGLQPTACQEVPHHTSSSLPFKLCRR